MRALESGSDWIEAGYSYYPLNFYFKRTFGVPVRKIGLDAGFACPHKSSGGCIFCEPLSFTHLSPGTLLEQLDRGISGMRPQVHRKYIAYFQNSTNTNAPTPVLKRCYEEAISRPEVVGISIGTRPDCVSDDVLDLLADISRKTWLQLELGLQTVHDSSLKFLNRGHNFETFQDAVLRAKERNLRIGVHMIIGIPGERTAEIRTSAKKIAELGLDSIKLHNLYVAKNTFLAELWKKGKVELQEMSEYVSQVVDFLELQSPQTVIERIVGDASEGYLLAPAWAGHKAAIIRAIKEEFQKRNTCQSFSQENI